MNQRQMSRGGPAREGAVMASRVIQGDVFDVLPTLEPGSIDCAVTSPPYWMLRSYLPKGHALKSRELGSEKTPGEYVAAMVRVFALVRDALADHGTCWVNVGDTFNGYKGGTGIGHSFNRESDAAPVVPSGDGMQAQGLGAGQLCLIPQRLALALQADGWLVRSVVIWRKPACMPASLAGWRWMRCRVLNTPQATRKDNKKGQLSPQMGTFKERYETGNGVTKFTDCPGCPKCAPHGGYVLRRGSWRPTSSYEPVLMLAKRSGYYCDGEAVKTPAKTAGQSREFGRKSEDAHGKELTGNMREGVEYTIPGMANLRDVWTIPAEPLAEKHYAAFPTELVRIILRAATSERGYCPHCGKPWARVVEGGESDYERMDKTGADDVDECEKAPGKVGNTRTANGTVPSFTGKDSKTLGWRQTCPCPPHEPRPARVLDPFAGSGRTGICCQRMFLDFTGIELNPEYHAMAERLLRDDCPLFST